jgi:hypothetical protein
MLTAPDTLTSTAPSAESVRRPTACDGRTTRHGMAWHDDDVDDDDAH